MIKTSLYVCAAALLSVVSAFSQLQQVEFASYSEGAEPAVVNGVLVDNKGTLATIALLGSNPTKATIAGAAEGEKVELKLLAHDPVSRLTLLQLPEAHRKGITVINATGDSSKLEPGDVLYSDLKNKAKISRMVSNVERYNGKILPLTFLRMNHPDGKLPAGSPVMNAQDQLIGFSFQKSKEGNSFFILPVEVLSHVQASLARDGKYTPCWIGVSMDQGEDTPVITSVRPESPASKAGLKNGDILVNIGGKKIGTYAEVVNAFYYLQPGKALEFRVLRGVELKTVKVTPEINPRYK